MARSWLFINVALLLMCAQGLGLECNKIDQCRCQMSDGSGIINLKSIGRQDNVPRWEINAGWWTFRYNPCYAFTSVQFTGLAVHQIDSNTLTEEYNLGLQSTESFSYNVTDGVSISYLSHDSLRKSRVALACEPLNTDHDLLFIGELIITEYEFVLTSPCACPGLCDDNGLIIPKTTTLPKTTTTANPNGNGNYHYWNDVGPVIVSLLIHDVIILVIALIVMAILKFGFDITCCSRGGGPQGGFPNPASNKSNPYSISTDA
ncbi:uncharacterized protein LOC144745997 [Ciona intestinalis]